MAKSFKLLFFKREFRDLKYSSDARLLTDDGCSFNVHKKFLSKENKYFEALFHNADETQNIFHIHGVRRRILDQILLYIYAKTLPRNREYDWDLLIASDYFLVDSLKLCIKEQLMKSLSIENVFLMYMKSLQTNDSELLKISYRYIETHFQAVITKDLLNFQEISFEFLKNILNENNLCVTGEYTVWKCIEKWVKVDPPCRLSLLPDLLKCLKTADIDDSLANEIIRSDILCKNPLYKDFIDTEYQMNPTAPLVVLKNVIQNCTGNSGTPFNQFQSHRHPKRLHIIAENKGWAQILYISYDENIDLLRKLGRTDHDIRHSFVAVIGLKVYILDKWRNCSVIFDLRTKEWSEMLGPRITRRFYKAVKLGCRIFIIGGELQRFDQETTSVEFYDTEQGAWFDAMPMMISVSHFEAVAYRNKIYVFGIAINESRAVTQVYDADVNRWSLLAPPNFVACLCDHFLEYHGKLYVIGGHRVSDIESESGFDNIRRKVQVFDIATDSWDFIADLPAGFEPCHASVINDQLIVFHNDPGKDRKLPMSPVTWNEEEGLWKPLDRSYLWYTNCFVDSIDSDVEIRAMLKELRDPATCFEERRFKNYFCSKIWKDT